MAKLSDFSRGVLTTSVIIYVLIFIYAMWQDSKKEKEIQVMDDDVSRYKNFAYELSEDMEKYKIGNSDKKEIEDLVEELLQKKEKE